MADYNKSTEISLAALAADLGAKAATQRIQRQSENAVKIPFILRPGVSEILERRYGFAVISEDHVPLTSDHPMEAIDREVCRSIFSKLAKPTITKVPTCYLGIGNLELSAYYRNLNSEFWVHGSEGKDTSRLAIPLLNTVMDRFGALMAASPGAKLGNGKDAKRFRLELDGLRSLVEAYELSSDVKLDGQFRIHMDRPKRNFARLVALDSAYEITESEWLDHFEQHGAMEAYVVGFYPNELLFDSTIPSTTYNYKRSETTKEEIDVTSVLCDLCELVLDLAIPQYKLAREIVGLSENLRKIIKDFSDFEEMTSAVVRLIVGSWTTTPLVLLRTVWRIKNILNKTFSDRVEVTFKGGYSNGYEHSYDSWSLLMRKPVLECESRDFVIEVECVQTAGSHRIFRLQRSTSRRPVVRTLSIHASEVAVEVLDVLETFSKPIPTPVYMRVLKTEFEQTINFLAGQKDETLTFTAVQTLVNRAAGGVKIATTEISPKWTMEPSKMWPFALAVALEALRRHKRAETMAKENTVKLRGDDTVNWEKSLKRMMHGVFGLEKEGSLSLMGFYQWCFTRSSTIDLWRELVTSKSQRWVPKRGREYVDRVGVTAEFEIPEKTAQCEVSCPTLKLMEPLGKQVVKCLHEGGKHESKVKITVTTAMLDKLRADIRIQREKAPADLVKVLDACKDEIPKVGFEVELELNMLIGGPGAGKSYTIRNVITNLDKNSSGKSFVYAPFSKLAPDYPMEARDGQPAFNFRTTHRLCLERGVAQIFLDEYTCMDEVLMLVACYKTSASSLWIVGDERQTGIQAHEGQRLFYGKSLFKESDFTKHILCKNFRNGLFSVAWANEVCGSGMYAENEENSIPEIYGTDELKKFPNAVTMGFSTATCLANGQTEETANTVRSNQGSTHDDINVPLQSSDMLLMDNDPVFLVALTRHRAASKLRFFVDDGPVKTKLRMRLRLDDEEFMARLKTLARPDLEKLYGKTQVDNKSKELEEFLAIMRRRGNLDRTVSEEKTEEEKVQFNEMVERAIGCKVTKEKVDGVCEVCERFIYEGQVCDDHVEEIKEDEVRAKHLREVLDFTSDGMCLAEAACKSGGDEVIQFMAPYKAWLESKGIEVGREGVSIGVFKEYCASVGLTYLIEEMDGDRLVDYHKHATETGIQIFLTLRDGHAEPMTSWRKDFYAAYRDFVWTEKALVRKRGSLVTVNKQHKMRCRTHMTLRSQVPRGFEVVGEVDLTKPCTPEFTRLVVLKEKRFGYKPVWSETFIELVEETTERPERTNRTFALEQERVAGDEFGTRVTTTSGWEGEQEKWKDTLHGTDVYSMAGFSDVGVTSMLRENHYAPQLDKGVLQRMKVSVNGILWPATRSGAFTAGSERSGFSFSSGFGLRQGTGPIETLASTRRYNAARTVHRTSVEGLREAVKMAEKNLAENYDLDKLVNDFLLEGAILSGWESDAKARGYYTRVEHDFEAGAEEAMVIFMNKAQDKISKKPYVDQAKDGQGISAVSPTTNFLYGPMFRVLAYRMASYAKSSNIFDCGMSQQSLKMTLADELRVEPTHTVTTHDVVECDSRQNWFTAAAEKAFWLTIANKTWHPQIEKYFRDVREMYKIKTFGLFSSQVQGPKPSGAPDTLTGNTLCVEMWANATMKYQGRKVSIKKGDDRTVWSTTAQPRLDVEKKFKAFTDFKMDTIYGQAAFTGKLVVPGGMYDDVVKKARKALMARKENYKSWAEYQQSLRDAIDEINEVGLVSTIGATAMVYGVSADEAYWYYQLLYSLSHISSAQWQSQVKDRTTADCGLPSQINTPFPGKIHIACVDYQEWLRKNAKTKSKTLTRREQRNRQKERRRED